MDATTIIGMLLLAAVALGYPVHRHYEKRSG